MVVAVAFGFVLCSEEVRCLCFSLWRECANAHKRLDRGEPEVFRWAVTGGFDLAAPGSQFALMGLHLVPGLFNYGALVAHDCG